MGRKMHAAELSMDSCLVGGLNRLVYTPSAGLPRRTHSSLSVRLAADDRVCCLGTLEVRVDEDAIRAVRRISSIRDRTSANSWDVSTQRIGTHWCTMVRRREKRYWGAVAVGLVAALQGALAITCSNYGNATSSGDSCFCPPGFNAASGSKDCTVPICGGSLYAPGGPAPLGSTGYGNVSTGSCGCSSGWTGPGCTGEFPSETNR